MNIADIASQVGTVYDRTLHTSLTFPYSGFNNIAIAQNDLVTAAVINNAISKLYANYIQLYRYSNVASNVIPISSIGFIGALTNPLTQYTVNTTTQILTTYTTTPVYTVTPSTVTETFTISSYTTVTNDLTSYNNVTTSTTYENLFVYSGDLSNKIWGHGKGGNSDPVVQTTIASPFNNSTVWKIVENKENKLHFISQTPPNNVLVEGETITISVYAKAAERNYLTIWVQDSDYSIFDLTTGTVKNVRNNTPTSYHNNQSSMQYVGNGWYRCILTLVVNPPYDGSYQVGFGPAIYSNKIPKYKGDGKSGVYVWGPQFIYGSQLYPYMESSDKQVGYINAPGSSGQQHTLVFKSSTKWVVPAGVVDVSVVAVGGGGGGGSGYEVGVGGGGGGGGSGGWSTGAHLVTPGQALTITVGTGGQGAIPSGIRGAYANGSSGGTSGIPQLGITAAGGAGGAHPGNYGGWGPNGTTDRFDNWGASPAPGGAGGSGTNQNGNAGQSGSVGTNNYSSGNGGAGGISVYKGYGTGGNGANFVQNGGAFFNGQTGSDGVVIVTYTSGVVQPQVQPLTITNNSQIANITEEKTLVPVFQTVTNTTVNYLSSVRYVTTAQTSNVTLTDYIPQNTLEWYTTSDFLSTSQFSPLATTQYPNLDNIVAITGGINTTTTPNEYVIFASTGTDLIALTGDTNLQNVSVVLSATTTTLYSNVGFTGINKLVLDPNTNHLYAVDLSANLVHQFNATGFFTNDNILIDTLVYLKSIGGYGNYDSAELFNNPESLAIYNSSLYILDSGNSCIKQYDTDFNWVITHRLFRDFYNNYPIDISVDGSGNIYVLTNTNKIIKYNSDFTTSTVIDLPALYNVGEYYQNIINSTVDSDIFYLVTNMNVYKKFYSAIKDTIGQYLFYRFNGSSGESITSFTSFINAVNTDTNVVFSTYNGAGKFALYADNINLDTVLVTDNFDVYPLSAIEINNNEYVQNWVFNKAIAKLLVNHTRLRNLIFSRFLYEPDDHGTLVFQGTRYLTADENLSVSFDQYMENFIGCNEIFQNIIVNRALEAVYNAQVSIFDLLQLDVETAPDLNIPVYIN